MSKALDFSSQPGRCERHLQRKSNNPLFPKEEQVITEDQLHSAQTLDVNELQQFSENFQEILKEFAALDQNVESDVVLLLKQRLDQLYEQVCGLGGDRTAEKAGLVKLHHAVNHAIAAGAAGDTKAEERLAEEMQAQNIHWQLLEESLVADLLRPESVISHEDLLPSLLSEDANSFSTIMGMFDPEQTRSLLTQAEEIVKNREDDSALGNARAHIKFLQELITTRESGR